MSEATNKTELIEQMRQDCLNSLYVFAQVVCGFDRLKPGLHDDLCNFMQYNDAIRKQILMPRDHFKSSIAMAFILWRLVRNPDERVLIASDVATTAQKKLVKIRKIIEDSRMMRMLFPDTVPDDTSKVSWSTEAIEVGNRTKAAQEGSVEAAGVEGARAGAHYTLVVCDDIATKEAKDQPSTMRKTIDWVDGLEAMLEEPYSNEIILIGTPWSHDDVYEHVRKEWSKGGRDTTIKFFSEFKKPFFDEEGEPIFPELYGGRANAMDFAQRMAETNPYLWSANYMLDPQVPNAEFDPDDLQYYVFSPNRQYLLYRGENQDEPNVVPVSKLQIYVTCDPAFKKDPTASKAAINVSGVAPDGNVFVLESIGQRGGTNALIEKIHETLMKYGDQVRRVGVEKAGQQEVFIDYLSKELRRRGEYRRIDGLKPGSRKSKEARIRSLLQPYFGRRQVWIRVEMKGLLDEYHKFPLSDVRDELDAMAYAAREYWSKAATGLHHDAKDYIEQYEKARQTASDYTGY